MDGGSGGWRGDVGPPATSTGPLPHRPHPEVDGRGCDATWVETASSTTSPASPHPCKMSRERWRRERPVPHGDGLTFTPVRLVVGTFRSGRASDRCKASGLGSTTGSRGPPRVSVPPSPACVGETPKAPRRVGTGQSFRSEDQFRHKWRVLPDPTLLLRSRKEVRDRSCVHGVRSQRGQFVIPTSLRSPSLLGCRRDGSRPPGPRHPRQDPAGPDLLLSVRPFGVRRVQAARQAPRLWRGQGARAGAIGPPGVDVGGGRGRCGVECGVSTYVFVCA